MRELHILDLSFRLIFEITYHKKKYDGSAIPLVPMD